MRTGGTGRWRQAAWIVALGLFTVPSRATAQLAIDFNDWTSDCIATRSCGATGILLGGDASLDTTVGSPSIR